MKKEYLLFVFAALLVLLSCGCNRDKPFEVEEGLMDLSKWRPQRDGYVALDGHWAFYPNLLLTPGDLDSARDPHYIKVPDSWNKQFFQGDSENLAGHGFGTYVLQIRLPEPVPRALTIKLGEINSAYCAFIGDKEVVTSGRIGIGIDLMDPEWQIQRKQFTPEGRIFTIIVQVANYRFMTGGIAYQSILLGLPDDIQNEKHRDIIAELFLIAALVVIGLYHLSDFFVRRKEYASLYLAIFTLLFALRAVMTGEKFFLTFLGGLPAELMITLAHLPNYIGLSVWMLFLYSIFPTLVSKKWLYGSLVVGGLLSLLVCFTPGWIYSQTMYLNAALQMVMTFYVLFVFFKAMKRGHEGGVLYFAGWCFFSIIVSIEVLGAFEVLPLREIIPFGIFVFLFFQSIMLSMRGAREFKRIQSMSAKLLAVDKLKDEFLAKTSHELRTPLTAIINIAESAVEETRAGSEVWKKNLAFISSSGKRLLHLINDILDFSKLKNRQLLLYRRAITLHSMVDVVVYLMKPLVKNKNVVIENRVPQDLPFCYADEYRLEQVVLNLLENAVKFTHEGRIIIDAEIQGAFIHVSVSDTGIGIPEDKLEDIFNSFEQLESSITQTQGVGLGLAICKELVDLHGGSIKASSDPGVETVFSFTIPVFIRQEEQDHLPDTRESSNSHLRVSPLPEETLVIPESIEDGKGSILVVDDELVNQQVLINYLTAEGYHVLSAFTGEEAFKHIEDSPGLDLVILDIMLPRMTGYEVCKIIRSNHSLHELPVLMLTAKTLPGDLVAGFDAGANDYVVKPFNKVEILSRIKTLINIKRITDENQVLGRLYNLKKRIVHLISHELENSLHGIVFSSRQLIKRQKFADTLSEQIVGSIYTNAEEIMNIFDKFIELSRLESGNITLHKEKLDARTIIKNVVNNLQIKADRKGQNLDLVIQDTEDIPFVEADGTYLLHILENLVSNAIKFSKKGRSIVVRLGIRERGDERCIFFDVEDEGPGLSLEDRNELFKEFHKLTPRPTGGELSSGLGLSIVKHLVDLHKGEVSVISELGKGSTFTVVLPAVNSE